MTRKILPLSFPPFYWQGMVRKTYFYLSMHSTGHIFRRQTALIWWICGQPLIVSSLECSLLMVHSNSLGTWKACIGFHPQVSTPASQAHQLLSNVSCTNSAIKHNLIIWNVINFSKAYSHYKIPTMGSHDSVQHAWVLKS